MTNNQVIKLLEYIDRPIPFAFTESLAYNFREPLKKIFLWCDESDCHKCLWHPATQYIVLATRWNESRHNGDPYNCQEESFTIDAAGLGAIHGVIKVIAADQAAIDEAALEALIMKNRILGRIQVAMELGIKARV